MLRRARELDQGEVVLGAIALAGLAIAATRIPLDWLDALPWLLVGPSRALVAVLLGLCAWAALLDRDSAVEVDVALRRDGLRLHWVDEHAFLFPYADLLGFRDASSDRIEVVTREEVLVVRFRDAVRRARLLRRLIGKMVARLE